MSDLQMFLVVNLVGFLVFGFAMGYLIGIFQALDTFTE